MGQHPGHMELPHTEKLREGVGLWVVLKAMQEFFVVMTCNIQLSSSSERRLWQRSGYFCFASFHSDTVATHLCMFPYTYVSVTLMVTSRRGPVWKHECVATVFPEIRTKITILDASFTSLPTVEGNAMPSILTERALRVVCSNLINLIMVMVAQTMGGCGVGR